jgi:hypothetical protein
MWVWEMGMVVEKGNWAGELTLALVRRVCGLWWALVMVVVMVVGLEIKTLPVCDAWKQVSSGN